MPRGGKREPAPGKKIGRPKTKIETIEVPDKGFATEVLAMIGTEIRKAPWYTITRETAKNAKEYALSLLCCGDRGIESANFNKLLDRRYGKPAQGVFVGDTREETRELDFGQLPMPAGAQPGTAGKPN